MGWWGTTQYGDSLQSEPAEMLWGDGPADALSIAFGAEDEPYAFSDRLVVALWDVLDEFRTKLGRLPTKQEMLAGVLFGLPELRKLMGTLPDGPVVHENGDLA